MFLLLAALLAQEVPKTQETITVERIIVDARVTDTRGEPITGLGADDFRVRIDGRPAKIESVLWVPETAAARALAELDAPPVEVNESMNIPAPRGRLLVFFFQTDKAREASRLTGQMSAISHADRLIESLEPEDRVAVFQFDSHLKFRLDFTSDKPRLKNAVRDALLIDDPPPPPVVPMPSLAKRLDRAEMKKAASSEKSLILLANALRPIPGPKSLILFGWGLGELVGGKVVMGRHYAIARRALESARVTVFSLDITVADWHSLEVGLGKAAEDTGGFYAKTHVFPHLAFERLQRTLAGHYELEVRKPEGLDRGVHTIDVQVKRRNAVVLARTSYVDRGE